MPLTKVELISGKSQEFKQSLMSLIGGVLIEVLELPDDDKNIRMQEYEKSNFIMKKPYEYLIEITLFEGRTEKTKKELYKRIVEELEEKLRIEKGKIFIVLNEQPLENWGVRGGTSAKEIKFNQSKGDVVS
jgi:phenylpyruvate tautomerase PptA (4-oxalocrotonate tautomerase family)